MKFGRDKFDALPQYCLKCDVRFACHDGCPQNRFITAPDGEPDLNYLCAGYKMFFYHIDQPMPLMVHLLRQNRAPAEVMRLYADQDQKWQALLAQTAATIPARAAAEKSLSIVMGVNTPESICYRQRRTIRYLPRLGGGTRYELPSATNDYSCQQAHC